MKREDASLRVAWHQARASLRIRKSRHLLTAGGITLSTAYLSLVWALRTSHPAGSEEFVKLTWLLLTSGVLCLIGITNSLLLSVAERQSEIGTFRCLGASDRFVVLVFLFETWVLGTLGGLMGCLLGYVLALTLGPVLSAAVRPEAAWPCLPIGLGLGLGLSLLAVALPVVYAIRIPASHALRSEV